MRSPWPLNLPFAEHGRGNVQMPPKVYITFPTGDFRTMPAYIPSAKMAGIKCVNVHPSNPALGLPTVMALTIILDIDTGLPKAILNATGLTDLRTGAAGAIACKYLSAKKFRYRRPCWHRAPGCGTVACDLPRA